MNYELRPTFTSSMIFSKLFYALVDSALFKNQGDQTIIEEVLMKSGISLQVVIQKDGDGPVPPLSMCNHLKMYGCAGDIAISIQN